MERCPAAEPAFADGHAAAGTEERISHPGEILARAQEKSCGTDLDVALPEKTAFDAHAFADARAGGQKEIRADAFHALKIAANQRREFRCVVPPQAVETHRFRSRVLQERQRLGLPP